MESWGNAPHLCGANYFQNAPAWGNFGAPRPENQFGALLGYSWGTTVWSRNCPAGHWGIPSGALTFGAPCMSIKIAKTDTILQKLYQKLNYNSPFYFSKRYIVQKNVRLASLGSSFDKLII